MSTKDKEINRDKTNGNIKTSKYDILALLREAVCRKRFLEVTDKKNIFFITSFVSVDFNSFYISVPEGGVSADSIDEVFSFTLHNEGSKTEFFATLLNIDFSKALLVFSLPCKMSLVQRRAFPRLTTKREDDFYCSGRYRNGQEYNYKIIDISNGGCAFVTKKINEKFLKKGAVIDFFKVSLTGYAEITLSVKVMNISQFIGSDFSDGLLFKISCQFLFSTRYSKKDIEKVIFKIAADRKIRR